MKFMYFAYGSNMLSTWLVTRCDSAKSVSIALARGYELEFTKRSRDGSGKATLTKAGPATCTPGVLFEICESQRGDLDKSEGSGYARCENFRVETANGPEMATTYLATGRVEDLRPYDWYLELIIAGALEHGVSNSHIVQLSAESYDRDPDEGRQTRSVAISALKAANHVDYRILSDD